MRSHITGMKEDGRMDRIKRGIAAFAGFCFLWVMVLLATSATIYNIAGDRALLSAEMERWAPAKISGLPEAQYEEVGRVIAEYLTGKRTWFQYSYRDADDNVVMCFHEKEEAHMADCRLLIRRTGQLRWALAAAALILAVAGIALHKEKKYYASGMTAGFILAALGILALLAWSIINFNSLFTALHRLLFTNNLWVMNSQTDLLIRLMPTSFFISMGVKLLLAVSAVALVCLVGAVMLLKTGNKNENQEEQTAAEAAREA